MSKIYVDEILPKDASKISMPDAELPAGSVVGVHDFYRNENVTISEPNASDWTTYHTMTFNATNTNAKLVVSCIWVLRDVAGYYPRHATKIILNGVSITSVANDGILDGYFRNYVTSATATSTDIKTYPAHYTFPAGYLQEGTNTLEFQITDATGTNTIINALYLNGHVLEVAQ